MLEEGNCCIKTGTGVYEEREWGMAGHIVKIAIEDTHPPVWRRVVVPEKITFEDMHEIIQILFGWEDEHLHGFEIPSKHITIDEEEFRIGRHYFEGDTLLDQFLLTNKWIRYTYDFGDDWRHRIQYEKTDEDYDKRCAALIKFRGDNFEEDCGEIWMEEEEEGEYLGTKPFDSVSVASKLSKLSFPVRECNPDGDETELLGGKDMEALLQNIADMLVQRMKKASHHYKETTIKDSQMKKRTEKWEEFIRIWRSQTPAEAEDTEYVQLTIPGIPDVSTSLNQLETKENTLEIVPGEKTQQQLLEALSIKEAADYCKYLRIPVDNIQQLKQMSTDIADVFRRNPEYILYVIDEEEYQELLKWLKLPCGKTKQAFAETDAIFKAIALGLVDFSMRKSNGFQRAKLSFAADIQDILSDLDKKRRKKVYRETSIFTERLRAFLFVYGVMEIEALYDLYRKIYRDKIEREDFLRLLYWHARFTEKLHTCYQPDGTGYASLVDIDTAGILEKTDKYAKDLEYALLSAEELKIFADDIWADNAWRSIVYGIFREYSNAPKENLEQAFGEMLLLVFNGETLPEVLKPVFDFRIMKESQLADICEIWTAVSGMMLEQRLPMLKGRSRMSYAEVKGISPWQAGMLKDEEMQSDSRTCPMCGFPAEIQEMMYSAVSFADEIAMRKLLHYKARNHICSEEFLYLLAEAHVIVSDDKSAEKLIRELKESSERGKTAAAELREALEYGEGIWDDEDVNLPFGGEPSLQSVPYQQDQDDDWEPQQPYVREIPKIGRNDPCPCGSGKKYKKCCGRMKNGEEI